MNLMRVLLIESNEREAMQLKNYLKRFKSVIFEVSTDVQEGPELLRLFRYDVIILASNLQGGDGFEILSRLKAIDAKTPVIFLSSSSQLESRLRAFRTGADDVLIKPFAPEELVERMKVLKRRGESMNLNKYRSVGSLLFNPEDLTLSLGKQFTSLTYKEGQILELLLNHGQNILLTTTIMEYAWDLGSDIEESTVQKHVSRLRQKIKELDHHVAIQVVRKKGYRLKITP